ncbi:MAG: cation diffusion facilitator family transporter [Patescibacteria group bacterium]|nr:cation diffusion facilitator family transporter [Patescibacteria group bacterium]MDD5121670.1 cation diffusion facilitator family transporter [Patescibacteria group bacterium]MDD5222233.1 cation diffusion facilitator family transporter [Patescibacteria group bacterium]MDD5396166.1 cation diffusion facilitator family transporter [Patescibacteria group bacterium]
MKEKIAKISILTNVFLAGSKLAVGFITGSGAIFAEGFHSGMDVLTSAISFVGIKIAKKPIDQKHPYGHYKFEVLAGLIITIVLFGTGLFIIFEAIHELQSPSPAAIGYLALGTMLISAVINEIMARLKIHYGKEENSVALLSDGFHSRIDVYASLVVLAGLFLTKYWVYVDSALALLIGLYIIKESFSIGKEAVDSLLDVSAGEKIEEKIKTIIKTQNIEISSLKTQKKGSAITANMEIKLPSNLSVEEAVRTSDNLREELIKEIENLSYVAIQIKGHEVETGFYKPAFGQSFGWQRKGKFRKEIKEAKGGGPGGYCVCPKCGYKILHERGIPCLTFECPKCKINLIRK